MTARSRLYLFSLFAIVVLSVAGGPYLLGRLRESHEQRLRIELTQKANMVAFALQSSQPGAGAQHLDEIVDELGKVGGARITVVAPNGDVIADSQADGAALAALDNHAERPEIVQARKTGRGWQHRYSTTLGARSLYVAVRGGPSDSLVRLAMPTQEVDKALSDLRLILLGAAGLGLMLASAIGALASHFATQTLRSLVESARSMGERGGGRVAYTSGDDLGVLAGSLNHLAEELENNVERLGHERDRLETILRGTSEGVLALDADGRIRLVNAAATGLLSLPNAVEGRPLYEVSREPDLLSLAERGLIETETVEIKLGSSDVTLLARADPLKATGGTVLVFHDVTEMRQLEGIRQEFVANVSHELRTPVSIIRANSETLIDGGAMENPKAREAFIKAISRNAERLEQLISDLLDLARIESGKQELRPRELKVRSEVERVVSLLFRKAEAKSLQLDLEIEGDLRLVADAQALDQILVNLIDNAIKYSDRPGCISIRAFSEEGAVVLCVDDEGPGIPSAARARLFERFYRVDAGRSREVGGTGLGLSIVKHLAQVMGGHVGVKPREPRGSRFWVSFPHQGSRLRESA